MKNKSTIQSDRDASVTRKDRYVTVAPSPLNAVKLDLGIILVLSALVWVLITQLVTNELVQFLLLFSFGLLATCWIVIRTRRVIKAHLQKARVNGETK